MKKTKEFVVTYSIEWADGYYDQRCTLPCADDEEFDAINDKLLKAVADYEGISEDEIDHFEWWYA